MARFWCRVVPAALTAAAVGAACLAGAHAQATKEPAAKAKKQDPVEAQRAIEAATKLLRSGKSEQAVQSLSATLAGGNLSPAMMAKAFYVRGMAYRQQKRPAQAISDLTGALWLNGGLGSEDRAEALKQRVEAYADAGLTERGEVLTPAGAAQSPAKQAGGGSWFNGLFNFGEPSEPPAASRPKVTSAATEPPAVATVPPAVAKAPSVIGGWASKTEVQADPAAAPAAVKPPKIEVPAVKEEAPPARVEGKFQVQLAAVRTKAEAMAIAAKARREHATVLAESESEIDQAVLGNMGSFYRVRFGPFASAQQSQAVCAKLKGSGLDCMPVTP